MKNNISLDKEKLSKIKKDKLSKIEKQEVIKK